MRAEPAVATRARKALCAAAILLAVGVAASSCTPTQARATAPAGPRARVVYSIATHRPVVFVTIDDGFIRDPRVIAFVRQSHWPISVFLIGKEARAGTNYFRQLQAAGATINDHTDTHPHLPRLSYAAQEGQICKPVHEYPKLFGTHPVLFRAPWGHVSEATLRAARACGFTTVIRWSAKAFEGNVVTNHPGPLRPGDIILMHFLPYLYSDLVRLQHTLTQAHLTVGRLEDYMPDASTAPISLYGVWSGKLAQ